MTHISQITNPNNLKNFVDSYIYSQVCVAVYLIMLSQTAYRL